MGRAVAVVTAGLHGDREALTVLLQTTPPEAWEIAGGLLELVWLLARIVAARLGQASVDVILDTAREASDRTQRMVALAVNIIAHGSEVPAGTPVRDVISGWGHVAGLLAVTAARQENTTPAEVLARIGRGVTVLEIAVHRP